MVALRKMLTVEDYSEDVARYIREQGDFTHNLISLTLRQVEREFGIPIANQIVDDFDLTKKFGIPKKVVKD